MSDRTDDFRQLAEVLGARVASFALVPWGDSRASWRLDLDDGRRMVARLLSGEEGVAGRALVEMIDAVKNAGIPVPDATSAATDAGEWLITSHVAGNVGAAFLDDGDRAIVLADAMGRLRRALLTVDLGATVPYARTPSTFGTVGDEGPIGAALAGAERALADRRARPVFVHGDFAPINVIVGEGGEIHALLDLEHAHLGDPLEDVAWWGWVVRHHHPGVWAATWPTFCSAAGVETVEDGPFIQPLILRQLARRAAAATDQAALDRWLARLSEAATWRTPV